MEYFEVEKDMEKFLNNKIAVNCRTKEDARDFLNFLASEHQMMWQDGEEISEKTRTYWHNHENETCYAKIRNGLGYGNLNGCKRNDYKVLIYKSIKSESNTKLESEQKINVNVKSSMKRKIFIIEDK